MIIVFDIGGTKMRFASVENWKIVETIVVKTPESYVEAIAEISEIIDKLSKKQSIDCMTGGVAGLLSKDGTKIIVAPNLKSWVGRPLVDDLSRISGAKVFIKNDTDMVGLGEAIHGSGKGFRSVAYLTFSTGIGGSLIISGEIPFYHFGFEPGFQIIDSNNKRQLHSVAGTELKEKYGLLLKDIKDEKIRLEIMKDVVAGIHNTIVFWSPDVVVLGGGMTETFDIDYIKNELTKIKIRFPDLPEIKLSALDDFGGLYGSIEFSKKLLASKMK